MSRLSVLTSVLLAVAALASCESQGDEYGEYSGKADSPFSVADLIDGTAPAVGLLRMVNDPSTTHDVLDDDARLRSDTARNIIAHRDGDSSASADPFDDIAELDGVFRVGPWALQKLLDFAFDSGFVPQGDEALGSYDGVSFTVNEAGAVLLLVNSASYAELDDEAALDSRAVQSIVDARPIASVLVLADLSFVGPSALNKLKSHQTEAPIEIGVLSDLDKTIVPPAPASLDLPDAPYPGIAELLNFLEFGDGSKAAGDVHYVTARQPESVTEIPTWLADHGIPQGPISTGISGIPFLARDEKVRDITEVFEGNPEQPFVMFGDSSHVDPDAYRAIMATFGDRVQVAFIHNVKTIDPAKLEGLFLVDNYAQAAAELFRRRLLSEDQARMVMQAVVAGGEITSAELEEFISANQPD